MQIPQKLVYEKFYVKEIAAVNLSKIYFLKNTKKECKPNNPDLNHNWIKTPERLSTLLIVNFGHTSLFFPVSCCWLWTCKCLLGPTLFISAEITCCCKYWQIYKNLSERLIRKDCDPKKSSCSEKTFFLCN